MPDHNSQEGQGLIKVAVVRALSKLFNDTQLDGLSPIKRAMLSNRATRRQGTCRHHVDSARLKKGLSLCQLARKSWRPGPIKSHENAYRIEVNRI